MIKVVFQNLVYPSITYSEIRIEIGSGDVTNTYYPEITKLGPFVLGYDDPNNILFMFPGSLSIDFYFPVAKNIVDGICIPSASQAMADYYNTMANLRAYGGTIYVYKEGQTEPYFCAAYDQEDDNIIQGSDSERSISLEFLDDYAKLNEALTFVGTDSSGYPGGGGHLSRKSIKKLIKELFDYSNRMRTSSMVDAIEYYIDFKFHRILDRDVNGTRTVDFEDCTLTNIGIDNWLFYHFDSKAECFKAVLRSLAAYAVLDFSRKLKILPLFYNGGPIKIIKTEQIEGDNKTEFLKRYEGLAVNLQYSEGGNYTTLLSKFADYGTVIRTLAGNENLRNSDGGRGTGTVYGDYLIRNDSKVFHLDLLFPCGGPDVNNEDYYSNSKRVMHVENDTDVFTYDPGTGKLHMIQADKVSYKKADGSWSEEKSLGDWAGWLTWQTLYNKSRWKRAIMPGLEYSYGDFFQVEGLDGTFRPAQISYDPEADQTKLALAECLPIDSYLNPTSIRFNRLLRAFKYSVEIKRRLAVASYMYSLDVDGEAHVTDSPQLGLEQLIIKIQNVYNCGSSTATEYDGIQLAISDYDKKLWRGNFDYVIYLAIGKTKDTSAPASAYPVQDDTTANWYFLARLIDQKIDNKDYYYQFVMNASKIKTKNPVWFWVGLLSSDARMFDGIPMWGV